MGVHNGGHAQNREECRRPTGVTLHDISLTIGRHLRGPADLKLAVREQSSGMLAPRPRAG